MKYPNQLYGQEKQVCAPCKDFRGQIKGPSEVIRLDLEAIKIAALTRLNRNAINRYLFLIRQRIAELCEQELPFKGEIEVDESYFGPKRVKGKRGRGAYGSLTWGGYQRSKENGQVFLWPHGCSPASWPGFRVNPEGQKPLRDAEMICTKELKNLATYVQEVDCPLDEHGLLKGMADRLGYKALTKKLEQILRGALK